MPEQPTELGAPAVAAYAIFTVAALNAELRQGEIITDLSQAIFHRASGEVEEIPHPYAVVLTQDCDLLQDYESRQKQEGGKLESVLLYPAEPAAEVKQKIGGKDLWKRVAQNSSERYHLLEHVPSNCDAKNQGVCGLVIDFKNFFTLRPEDIYEQCGNGSAARRCRLEMPYREHLQCRAAFYFQRVSLPVPHQFLPPTG